MSNTRIEFVDVRFKLGDGRVVSAGVDQYGVIHQWSKDHPAPYADTAPLVGALRDALLESGLSAPEKPALRLVTVASGSQALADHLIAEHGETPNTLMVWALLRSDPVHADEEAIYPDKSVLQHLEDMHLFQHDNTDNEFDHTHEGVAP